MKPVDVWFARYNDALFVVVTEAGTEPMMRPRKASSVKYVFKRLRDKGVAVSQVGILSPEMIGLL